MTLNRIQKDFKSIIHVYVSKRNCLKASFDFNQTA